MTTDTVRPMTDELGDMLAAARTAFEVTLGLRDQPPAPEPTPEQLVTEERLQAENDARELHQRRVQTDPAYRAAQFPVPGSAPLPPPGAEAAEKARREAERREREAMQHRDPVPAEFREAERAGRHEIRDRVLDPHTGRAM
jgi:hypothetical protein